MAEPETNPTPTPEPKPEDKAAEYAKLQAEYQKLKVSFDKTSHDYAALKKDADAKKTDEEKRAEEIANMQAELETLKKEKAVSESKTALMGAGFDADSAAEIATAMADGDTTKLAESLKTYRTNLEKTLRAEILKGTPGGSDDKGGASGTMTREEILKIRDTAKRQKAMAANPGLFPELS